MKRFGLLGFLALLLGGFLGQAGAVPLQNNEGSWAANTPQSNKFLSLNGINRYVEIPHDPALNPTGAFTIEAWVKRASGSRCETIISKGYTTAYWLGFCTGTIRFYASGIAPGSRQDGITPIPADVWTHIAVVYQGSGRRYYINGELDYQGGPELAPTTNSLPVWIGSDPGGCCDFQGRIANVRLWNVARTQEEIRRTMHQAFTAPRDGLVANWRFSEGFEDNVGGFDGTAVNGAIISSDWASPPPAQAAPVPLDEGFNQITFASGRRFHAIAAIPGQDRALGIGGRNCSGCVGASNKIFAISGTTGEQTTLDSLPVGSAKGAAVFVPTQDQIYYFGGTPNYHDTSAQDAIYAIDPVSGAPTTLTAVLPQPSFGLTAVYHPDQDKIWLFGGHNGTEPVDSIAVFDPATETITATTTFTLPQPLASPGGVYSPLTGSIYLFGGYSANSGASESDAIYQITLNDAGDGGVVTPLPTTLPQGFHFIQPIADPETGLIYLSGGYDRHTGNFQQSIWIFDPLTNEVWDTHIFPSTDMAGAAGFYSPRQRHLVFLGGGFVWDEVWRLPVGDGPLVPLGRWDFPTAVGAQVNDIDAAGDTAVIATKGDGAWLYRDDGSQIHLTAGMLGSASGIVNNVRYNATYDHTFLATDDAGALLYDGSTVSYPAIAGTIGTSQILAIDTRPGYTDEGAAPFLGGSNGLYFPRLNGVYPFQLYVWNTAFSGQSIRAVAHQNLGTAWVLSGSSLEKMTYTLTGGSTGTTNYGTRCGLLSPTDLTFAGNGDWWIVSPGSTEFGGNGICRIPAGTTPGSGNSVALSTAVGNWGRRVSTDGDDRVWVALVDEPTNNASGGLEAFEVTGSPPGTLAGDAWNWLNAPIGSRTFQSSYWDSTLTAVSGSDERLWLGNNSGDLFTLAQRWQQIDDNGIGSAVIQDVWTARGRTFLAGSSSLHVLQPDGETWDNRSTSRVWDVLADEQGRIWAATNTGLRLYTPTGWDYLTDKPGTRPATAVYALAEDGDGRIWIGGLNGLTLFDRERFVATFTPANSDLPALPITTLFVDRRNRLWAGSNSGLAMLDGAAWINFTTGDGLPDNRIHDITQLPTGEIVVSTANGLSFYNGSSFATQTLPIPANDLPVVVDDGGYLYAGSAVYDGSAWTQYYTTNSGLASSQVSGLATDNADRVWFSHAPDAGVSVRGSYLPPLGTVIPQITGITPSSGSSGDIITINGSGFPYGRSMDVTIGGDTLRGYAISDTQIKVTLSDYTTSGDVSLRVGDVRATLTDAFCAQPVITDFTPTGGNDGVFVTITGTNFDYTGQVRLGGGPARFPAGYSPVQLRAMIQSGDGSGPVTVNNDCPGVTTNSSQEFRRITLTLEQMVFNQGITTAGLVAGKPTMVQHYLSADIPPRDTDLIEVEEAEITFTEGGTPHTYQQRIEIRPFVLDGPPSPADLADIDNSLNLVVTPALGGNLLNSVPVQTTFKNHGQVVAVGGGSANFRPDLPLRVLLVPIMPNDYTRADLEAMQRQVNGGLDNLRRRLSPLGTVELYWSPMVFRANDVLQFGATDLDIGNSAELYDASHNINTARRVWNENHDPDVLIAMGIVHNSINRSTTAGGQAFWPDVSQMANTAGLSAIDSLCDVGSAILNFFTLGAVDQGCDLELPLYVGWAESTWNSSRIIGHEMGHTMSLVPIPAPNADLFDNFSHSRMDEIQNGTCGDVGGGGTYNEGLTLYAAPGVQEPVVNPLTGGQWRPSLAITATATISGTPVTSEAFYGGRGKAIMSYACSRVNDNIYFEPADMVGMLLEYTLAPGRLFADLSPVRTTAVPLQPHRTATTPSPIFVPGTRLALSGTVDRSAGTGQIVTAQVLGDSAPLDISYVSDYALVQVDGSGGELARTGLFPVFRTSEGESDSGFWAATIIAEPGVAAIELRQNTAVLDTFAAGSQTPTVTLTSPSGGSFANNADIPVTWVASDGDGDPMTITILYSADGGTSWTAVAESDQAAGTIQIPASRLAGSSDGRIRVTADDGLHQGEATSPPIQVAAAPPQPFIGTPAAGSSFLEGMALTLSGGAFDNQDGLVAGANLAWGSDRDGALGTGETLDAALSVGLHTLTLTATNSAGLSATTTVTVTITGDYDLDGIPDSEELADGLNLLTAVDAFSDADGDGLSLRVERKRGLDPDNPDSDGDGRDDGVEVGDGTDPLASDPPLPPDSLSTYPNAITLDADLSLDLIDPQVSIMLASRDVMSWTLSADVNWLGAFKTQGQTPDQVTVIVKIDRLSGDGVYTGNLFFDTNQGRVTVPITLNATNVPQTTVYVYLPVILKP